MIIITKEYDSLRLCDILEHYLIMYHVPFGKPHCVFIGGEVKKWQIMPHCSERVVET